MKANVETNTIIISNPRHHAVAMTALMHGLRLYRIEPDVRAELDVATVEKARKERESMLEQGYGTKSEYDMSYEAAEVAMMGFKRFQEVGVNAGNAATRIARQNLANRFAQEFDLLANPPQKSA